MGNAKSSLDIATLRKAVDSLHIRDIYLRDAHIRVEDDYVPKLHAGEELTVQLRWGPEKATEALWASEETKESDRVFLVTIQTAVRFVRQQDSEKPAADVKPRAEISCSYMAEYKINTSDPIPAEAFDQFARHNVIYHVWPYWREWLHTTCARAQLPNFTLPMYVLRSKEPEEKEAVNKE